MLYKKMHKLKHLTGEDVLTAPLDSISVDVRNNGSLFIDGAACSGKSTFITKLNNLHRANSTKVNVWLDVDDYNFDANTAFHYMELLNHELPNMINSVIDRSPISNIAFQYVYWLMKHINDSLTPFQWCENYTKIHRMEPLLEFVKSKRFNIVVVINTNYDEVKDKMLKRGSDGDVYKGRIPLYLKCQVYAFIYLATVLDLPVLNHAHYEDSYNKIYKMIESHYLANMISDNKIKVFDRVDDDKPKRLKLLHNDHAIRRIAMNMNKR